MMIVVESNAGMIGGLGSREFLSPTSCGVAAGASRPGTAARRFASGAGRLIPTGSGRRIATGISAFVSVWFAVRRSGAERRSRIEKQNRRETEAEGRGRSRTARDGGCRIWPELNFPAKRGEIFLKRRDRESNSHLPTGNGMGVVGTYF